MRRAAQIATLLLVVGLVACTPTSPALGAPPASDAQATPKTWQETSLPSSAAPGASADDSVDERQDGEKRGKVLRIGAVSALYFSDHHAIDHLGPPR